MKGRLKKIGEEWVVTYDMFQDDHSYPFPAYKIIPLHPDDVKQIEEDSKVFDNIEARIAAYPEVEFEIKYYWDGRMEQPIDVAKLIDATKEQTNGERFEEFMRTVEGYPELEGTNALSEDIIKKRTGKMTEEEWQAAERAQTSIKTVMTSIEWFIEQLEIKGDMRETSSIRNLQLNIDTSDYLELKRQAKEMHKQEISDEEIEEEIRNRYMIPIADYAWRDACEWYREQLKNKI